MQQDTDGPPATSPAPPRGAERFGAWYDAAAAAAACAWFPTHLRHTEAEWAGRPFVLADWQAERVVAPVFGWKRQDGTRLYRRVWLEVPRKNGKTELAAGVSLLALCGDAEMGGQGYSLAVDLDQAEIVFGKAATMVALSPTLGQHVTAFKTSLWCQQLLAAFKPLSSVADTKHGFGPSFAIGDEVHVWPDGELLDVVHRGMVHRRQPLEILITTAGLHGVGYAWEMHQYAAAVAAGEIEDPELLPVIFAAGADDDWREPSTWRKANPNFGVSVKPEFIDSECRKAQASAKAENEFRRYHLNQWVEQVTRWLPMADWDACAPGVDPLDVSRGALEANAVRLLNTIEDSLRGRPCWGGLDLSSTRDVSALAWVFKPTVEGGAWPVIWRFWIPEAGLKERVEREGLPWDLWAELGLVTLTPGNVTDYRSIKTRILGAEGSTIEPDAEKFALQELAIDRWNASQTAVELAEEGLPVAMFGQGFASMSAPSKELERLVLAHLLAHGGNPVARAMARVVSVETDAVGNIKPVKTIEIETGRRKGRVTRRRQARRVDGIIAAIMALGRATVAEAPPSYQMMFA